MVQYLPGYGVDAPDPTCSQHQFSNYAKLDNSGKEKGRRIATPLLLCLSVVQTSQ